MFGLTVTAVVGVAVLITSNPVEGGLPPTASVLANGNAAAHYYITNNSPDSCNWERGPLVLGLIELAQAGDITYDPSIYPYKYLLSWANEFNWTLCSNKRSNANNQLCGATYAELYRLDGKRNQTMIADTLKELDLEITNKDTSLWSWVDALFMAMNTWSRIGSVTGEQKYFDMQFELFNAAALEGPSATTYHFWSDEHNLFYRDDHYLNSTIFWGRGNGWAMGALVAALQHSPAADPHRETYESLFKKQSASLKALQTSDGCWGGSLLNETGYPPPETTGSSSFTYGLAYGINSGILAKDDYLPVVEKAWGCLAGKALQPSGLFGYCQPVGASPAHNISPNSTSDFCVGLFLLAASQVAQLTE